MATTTTTTTTGTSPGTPVSEGVAKANLELARDVNESVSDEKLLLALFFATNSAKTQTTTTTTTTTTSVPPQQEGQEQDQTENQQTTSTTILPPCCIRCACRLLGLRIFLLFAQPESSLAETLLAVAHLRKISAFQPPFENVPFPTSPVLILPSSTVCGLCLGILQGDEDLAIKVVKRNDGSHVPDTLVSEDVSLPPRIRILHSLQACRHQYTTFQFNITVPQSIVIRQAVFLSTIRLLIAKPAIFSEQEGGIVEVKEAIKWMLGVKMDSKFEMESAFTIKLNFQHPENRTAITKLLTATNTEPPKKKRVRYNARFRKGPIAASSSSSSSSSSDGPGEDGEEKINAEEEGEDLPATLDLLPFANIQPLVSSITSVDRLLSASLLPITQPSQTASMEITYEHTHIYVAGRYNKFTRKLSQTPWMIDGKRKTESSIEELIGIPTKEFYDADSFTFMAAGREDVDVRMLGTGRPFILEIHNPRRALRSADDFPALQKLINTATDQIKVRDLQPVPKVDTNILKEGEESKRKTYRCLVRTSRPLSEADYEDLKAYYKPDAGDDGKAVVTVAQETPLRVLHRRTLAIRQKEIYSMQCIPINDHYLFVDVETQAGTYVKEFIHGDLGRTVPNFGTLSKSSADILSLDVISIKMDFPPRFVDRDDDGGSSPPENFPIDFIIEDETFILASAS